AGAAERGGQVDVLASSAGRAAAGLLPGVRDVLVFDAPWSGYAPPPLDRAEVLGLVETLAARRYASAVIFTSFHQSPLPMALLARLAGIGHVAGTSEDYPGSLLDVRHRRPDGLHEVEAALDLARAAGYPVPTGDDGRADDRMRVREPLPDVRGLVPAAPYVVVHPGASVPARAPSPDHAAVGPRTRTRATERPPDGSLGRATPCSTPGPSDDPSARPPSRLSARLTPRTPSA
uniref:glycosyltransferase family 9 protein n=1 Tax=Cellulosimicrobium cellulans TaxID=1710 RepID=UPI000A697115